MPIELLVHTADPGAERRSADRRAADRRIRPREAGERRGVERRRRWQSAPQVVKAPPRSRRAGRCRVSPGASAATATP